MNPPDSQLIHPSSSGRIPPHPDRCRVLLLTLLLHAGLILAGGCAVKPDRHHLATDQTAPFLKGVSPDGQTEETVVFAANECAGCPTDLAAARAVVSHRPAWTARPASHLKQWPGGLAAAMQERIAVTDLPLQALPLLWRVRAQIQRAGITVFCSILTARVEAENDGAEPVLARPVPQITPPRTFDAGDPVGQAPPRGQMLNTDEPGDPFERFLRALALLMLGSVLFVPLGCATVAGIVACPSR